MTPTADTLVPDDLWQAIQPLLPTPPFTCWRRLRDCGAPGCGSSCTTFLDQLGREGKLDRGGIPLAACVSGHTHDSMLVEAIVDAVPPVKGPRGDRGGRHRTWWSGRWRGWWDTGGSRSATSGAPTSCSALSSWPAP